MANTLLVTLGALIAIMLLLWIVGTALVDVSIVDVFWGCGFIVVAWIAMALNAPPTNRVWLLAGLMTLWGMRLSCHLFYRRLGKSEDRRYAAMRVYHGDRFWWVSLITVFCLQAVIIWFVAWPLQIAAVQRGGRALGWCDALGVALFTLGLVFEALGDWQLTVFQANPANRNRVLDRGLWRYTRHPNYFGDFCVWWGFYLIAAAGGAWWTIGSPLVMSILLLKVSGVTLLESKIQTRRPEYASYIQRTNAFLPGWPKRQ